MPVVVTGLGGLQKAFDQVPHQWLYDLLEIIKAPKAIAKCLRCIVPMWKTTFSVGKGKKEKTFEMRLKREVFQGNSLSPVILSSNLPNITHAAADKGLLM